MSKNNKMYRDMERQLNEKKKILEESVAMRNTLAYLIEGELEKAEIVLAAKGILDDLQRMMENIAKIDAEDLIPLQDSLTQAYGPQVAEDFRSKVADALRQATESVKTSRDAITAEVSKLEGILNGDSTSDMALNVGAEDAPLYSPSDAPADDQGGIGFDDDEPQDGSTPSTDATVAPPVPGKESAVPQYPKGEETPDLGAAGRIKKESIAYNKKALSEAKDSDTFLMNAFRKALKGNSPIKAVKYVAESYGIRVGDLIEIINDKAGK